MSLQMWLANLAAFSVQVAALVAAGTALVYTFRLKSPVVLLAFWQVLLAVCLLLPVLEPWRQAQQPVLSAPQEALDTASLPVFSESADTIALPAGRGARSMPFPTYRAVAHVLAGGVILRLLWLMLGLLRLRRYLHRARRPAALPESVRDMQWSVGVTPEVFFSPDIDTPVTFGWHRPAVLLPNSFNEMSAGMQRTVACHELLHVERGDWFFVVLEELLRSLLWFHPAIWWALGRIHLSREQVVDRKVLRVTGERGPYLESLLHIASLRGRPAAVPAPLLLREHHLVQRVALMLKESKMNRSRLIASLAASAAFLLWTGTYAAAWFPLTAPAIVVPQVPATSIAGVPTTAPEPESAPVAPTAGNPAPAANPVATAPSQDAMRVGGSAMEAKLIREVNPVYPELAKRARVEQIVMLEVTVNEDGLVSNVRVLRGHPLLDQAAVDAVRQWQYSPTLLNGRAVPVITTVTINFSLGANSSPGATDSTLASGTSQGTAGLTTQGSTVIGVLSGGGSPAVNLPQRVPLRVGGNVQESKIIKRVDPVYPEMAKRARIEQIVMLEVTVNEEGTVSNVRVIRGHPLLDQAAIDAVRQWVYAPTLLNGQPVPVVATVTVIFSLSARFTLDADGYIRDTSGAIVSVDTLRGTEGSIQITPGPQTSFDQIQQTLAYLQVQGVQNFRLNSQSFTFASGRLFYLAPTPLALMPSGRASFVPPTEIPRAGDQVVHAPTLEIDADQLVRLAQASGSLPQPAPMALSFTICVDETGRIVGVQSPGGPLDVPEVTAALRAARVTRPGFYGNAPVPVALRVVLSLPIK